MKKLIKILLLTAVILSSVNSITFAGDMDILLDKLVEKGIFTGAEAQEVKYETEEEIKKEISLGKHRTLPYWLQSITVGGDLRIRYQKEDNSNLTYIRHRIRERVRIYINSKVNDNLFLYNGVATGENTDSRSTNQTLTDNFSKKNIYLDYAYFEYTPFEWLSFLGGRIKQAVYLSNDMLWDSDINQDGGVLKIEKIFNSNLNNSFYAGGFIIKENSDRKDQYIKYLSDMFTYYTDDRLLKLNMILNYYIFANIKNANEFSNRPGANYIKANTTSSGRYVYNYKPVVVDMEISKSIEEPISLYTLNVNNFSLFSTYVKNTAISLDKGSKGWIAGIRLGQEKIQCAWDFQISYSRRWLESNAWLDTYPDSDFYGGSTDVKGDEIIFNIGLGRDFYLTADYYNSKPVKSIKKEEKLFQLDINMKF